MVVISLSQLSVALMGRLVLRRLTATVAAGQQVLLTGANGAGKTTLLRTLATAIRPQAGHLELFSARGHAALVAMRPRLTLMTHQHHFYEALSARQNLALVGQLTGHRDLAKQRRILEQVGLGPHQHRAVMSYSAGMKRRLGLARIELLSPQLVLLDEPFGQLDQEGLSLMHKMLMTLRERGATVIVATHDIERARGHCDLHWHLDNGTLHVAPLEATHLAGGAP